MDRHTYVISFIHDAKHRKIIHKLECKSDTKEVHCNTFYLCERNIPGRCINAEAVSHTYYILKISTIVVK